MAKKASKGKIAPKPEHKTQNILWLILTISITLTCILSAFQPILVNIVVNVLLPVAIMIFCKLVFFERLKLTTLTLLRVVVIFAVFNILDRQLFVNIVLIFLAINILEATFTDIFRYKRYFNGVTGLVMAVSVWFLRGSWLDFTSVSELGFFAKFMHMYEFHAATTIGLVCWIIAYTIWNWVFVTNEFSASVAKLHVGILAAPILGSLMFWNPGYWLAFRAGSLAFGGCIQIAEKEFVEDSLRSDKFSKFVEFTKKNSVQAVLMVLNIALMAVTCFMK